MNNTTKNRIIIILSIIIILLAITTCVLSFIKNKKNNNLSQEENNPNNVNNEEQIIKDLLYNNYIVSYLLEDDVKIGEGTLKIDGDKDTYYAVTDYLLEDLTSLEDINLLLESTLDEIALIRARKFMASDYGNHYIDQDGTLYVKKSLKPCEVSKNGPIDRTKISTRIEDNNYYVIYDNIYYQLYKDDNNKLKASTLWFNCVPNFNEIGLEADDVYEPKYEEENIN